MFDHIERVLYSCEQEGKDIIMLGDLNCDLLAEEPCCYTKRLNNITSTSHLNQLITEATCITEDTESLLDHVYVSDVNKVVNSGVIHTGVSDNSLIYVTVGNVKVSKKGHKYQINREYKYFNDIEFVSDLSHVNWTQVTLCNDVSNAVEKFQAIFLKICNQHASLKKKHVRNKKAPWLTDDVIRLMREGIH